MIIEQTLVQPDSPERRSLEQELYNCDWICAKCHEDYYAQNLYAAMSNMRWQPLDLFPILREEYWTASWRSSGRIVANIRNKLFTQPDGYARTEDYMDWYCSGIVGDDETWSTSNRAGYVSEGFVTQEIREDLAKLGWRPVPYDDKHDV